MKKKQLVFRPTGEVRQVDQNELYFVATGIRMATMITDDKYPIYEAVEEVIDVPLWRAELRQPYYYFNEMLEVKDYNNNGYYVDEQLYTNGNHFQTEQETEKYSDLIKFILTERLLDNVEFQTFIEQLKGELQ